MPLPHSTTTLYSCITPLTEIAQAQRVCVAVHVAGRRQCTVMINIIVSTLKHYIAWLHTMIVHANFELGCTSLTGL